MDILKTIDELEEIIETAGSIPLTGKIAVDKNELLELIQNLRLDLPNEIKEATWVKDEREKILSEAEAEANQRVTEAEEKSKTLLDENYIMQLAYEKAERLVNEANDESAKIRQGARDYADEVLQNTQENLSEVIRIINNNRQQLKN